MNIANNIKAVAKEHGFTLVQVAEKLGITKGGLSQSINGNPTIGTLQSIADVIGCKVGDFFRDEMEDRTDCKVVSNSIIICPHCNKKIVYDVITKKG